MHEYESLSAPALEMLVESGLRTAIAPFASIEHQGAHLPLGADLILGDAVGREVAARLDALLLPTIPIGDAAGHAASPGTLTLSKETLVRLAYELGESLAKQGLVLIALVSTHGGNAEALRSAADRLNTTYPGVRVLAPAGDLGPNPGSHSGAWLASVIMALRPELVQLDAAGAQLREELDAASPERGRAHLERFIGSVVEQIRAAVS